MIIDWDGIKNKKILIYGAHLVAIEVYREISHHGYSKQIIGFAVTDKADNPLILEGKSVRQIDEYSNDSTDCVVFIAMPAKFHDEVERVARGYGFSRFIRMSLETMSEIKGSRIKKLLENLNGSFSKNDISWLDITLDGSKGSFRCKYPTLFYLNDDELLGKSSNIYNDYCLELLGVNEMGDNDDVDVESSFPDLRIYMAFDKSVINSMKSREFDPWERPLQVGSKGSDERYGEYHDDQGEFEVSGINRYLAEMTGASWIWHHAPSTKYKGLCHYRRHFDLSRGKINIFTEGNIDVLLTTPRFVPGGIRDMFVTETPVKEPVIESMMQSLEKTSLDDVSGFDIYLTNKFYFPNNMVVAKSEIYDEYCAWIIPILLGMVQHDIESNYGHEFDRHIAYASELLTSYYFIRRKDQLKIYYTDYVFSD